jgi:hypothetical protein
MRAPAMTQVTFGVTGFTRTFHKPYAEVGNLLHFLRRRSGVNHAPLHSKKKPPCRARTPSSQQEQETMNKHQISTVALAVSAVLTASVGLGQEPVAPIPPTRIKRVKPQLPLAPPLAPPRVPHTAVPVIPDEEVQTAVSSNPSADISPLAATGTTLSPPVTITYGGSSNAVTIKDSGTNRGLSSTLSNSGNSNSAVYGETNGTGAGVKGINYGTRGPGGIFQVTDSASSQSGLFASTSGTGSAIVGTITKSSSDQPAIHGQSVGGSSGIGVEGEGSAIGVYGYSASGSAGVFGSSGSGSGSGVAAYNSTGNAVFAYSGGVGYGVKAFSEGGYGVYGSSEKAAGVTGTSDSYFGVYGFSNSSFGGVEGVANSEFGAGVDGENDAAGDGVSGFSFGGAGVHGGSTTGYAGLFDGVVAADLFKTLSDRNAKTDFQPIDSKDILDRVRRLPITSWHFKTDLQKRHVGPVAQDFHAAFGLDGDDDKHISLSDSVGVSLAAIQELTKRLKQKDDQIAQNDARIAALETQLKAMNDRFSARVAKLEQRTSGSAETATASLQSDARVSALSETRE